MAGPFATYFLCLLGAEVIKIEPEGVGDLFRNYDADPQYAGMSPAFIAANAGKKSVVLDLKSEFGLAAARKLIATADVVMENFRPGVMDRLGLGYESCRALSPNVVFCSLSGYGQTGPFRDYPAIDNVVQATAGVMSITGDAHGPPVRMGVPIVDTYTGTLAAVAMLSALLQRERFGGGQKIDVSMFDATMVMLTSAVTSFLVKGEAPNRAGNLGYSGQPTAGMFACADGKLISLGVVRQNQWFALCALIDRPDLVSDPRFASVQSRRTNFDALSGILTGVFAMRRGEEWEAALSAGGVPCGLVRDVGEACAMIAPDDPRHLKIPMTIPGLPRSEQVHVLNAGFVFAHDGPGVSTPPPRHGEHTEEVLRALGMNPAGKHGAP